ncbi:GH14794 [Drosophila grimshawi]|uniref:GH14794 n=1 Tax=Drosophila grimshawi TaxID=7222 RepID=B4J3D7_DROGR|nr:GH14794 [Drosophila grimshawi]
MNDFDSADGQAAEEVAAAPETKEAFKNENFKPSKSTNETYTNKYMMGSRNPITGTGLNGDGVGGLKPKTAKDRGEY